MINATFTLRIESINETHNSQGVKIAYGDCSFQSYSKDGLVNNTIPFRAKGSTAVVLTELGVEISGVAIGYLDLQVIDSSNGYKEKQCTLVIRNFVATQVSLPTNTYSEANHQAQPQTPSTAELDLAVTTSSQESSVDVAEIPF